MQNADYGREPLDLGLGLGLGLNDLINEKLVVVSDIDGQF